MSHKLLAQLINENSIAYHVSSEKAITVIKKVLRQIDLSVYAQTTLVASRNGPTISLEPKLEGVKLRFFYPNWYHQNKGDFSPKVIKDQIGIDPKSLISVNVGEVNLEEGVLFEIAKIPWNDNINQIYLRFEKRPAS